MSLVNEFSGGDDTKLPPRAPTEDSASLDAGGGTFDDDAGERGGGHPPTDAAPPTDDARMKALQECNVRAQKYIEHTWGDVEIYTYRSCMMEHGQPE